MGASSRCGMKNAAKAWNAVMASPARHARRCAIHMVGARHAARCEQHHEEQGRHGKANDDGCGARPGAWGRRSAAGLCGTPGCSTGSLSTAKPRRPMLKMNRVDRIRQQGQPHDDLEGA